MEAYASQNYTTHVASNNKTISLAELGNRTYQYKLDPIPVFAIGTIASMQVKSHALRCETWGLGTTYESGRLCIVFPKQVRESKYETLIQCSAFDHI